MSAYVVAYGTFRYRGRLLLVCGEPGAPVVELHRTDPVPVVFLGTVDTRRTTPMLRSTLPRQRLYDYGAVGAETAAVVRAADQSPNPSAPRVSDCP